MPGPPGVGEGRKSAGSKTHRQVGFRPPKSVLQRAAEAAGAGLDVYEDEPAMAEGLADCPNAVLLPHVASASSDTRGLMATMAATNAVAHLRGEPAPNIVNPEVYETDVARVAIGQRATVTSPALPEPLTGVVEWINLQIGKQDALGTDPAARKDARVVEVEIRLDDSTKAAALTNLQVEAEIHVLGVTDHTAQPVTRWPVTQQGHPELAGFVRVDEVVVRIEADHHAAAWAVGHQGIEQL